MSPDEVRSALANSNARFAAFAPGQPLGEFSAERPFPERFPYGPESVIRMVASEPVLALLLPRALVMEVADPKVGAGVDQHSHFKHQPLRRLLATGDCALRLSFGGESDALAAASHIYAVHDRIYGHLPDAAGRWGAGSAYTAHDASLLLWVWATIVDTFKVGFERWVRPLSEGEADELYADQAAFALFFGIPSGMIPPDRKSFESYLTNVVHDQALGSSPTSQALAHDIVYFDHPLVPSPIVRAQRALSVTTLDPTLVSRLGLRLCEKDRRLALKLDAALTRHYRRLPQWRKAIPSIYLRGRRLLEASGFLRGS